MIRTSLFVSGVACFLLFLLLPNNPKYQFIWLDWRPVSIFSLAHTELSEEGNHEYGRGRAGLRETAHLIQVRLSFAALSGNIHCAGHFGHQRRTLPLFRP
jgi:hypothetical protein